MRELIFVACAAAFFVSPLQGQERAREDRQRDAMQFFFHSGSPNRAALGITTSAGTAGDTLGVLVSEVTPGSPAQQAGITEGSRIASINDVSLRLSPEDARAGDMADVAQRRLVREMARVSPGDEVRLRVHTDGRARDVRVRTVPASELRSAQAPRIRTMAVDTTRPMLGITVGGTGTERDTLGLFVSWVRQGSPAERAGIIEGHRVAEINGVNVRVPREDAGDPAVRSAMSARFSRELRNTRPGESVQLRVWADGRFRDVRATPVPAHELGGAELELFPGAGVRIFTAPNRNGATIMLPEMRQLEERLRELPERIRGARIVTQRVI